jgi:hypothetical protein
MGEFKDGIFRKDPNANFVVPGKDESPEFDIPWYVAKLIKEWAQYIVPLQFLNLM